MYRAQINTYIRSLISGSQRLDYKSKYTNTLKLDEKTKHTKIQGTVIEN